MILLCGIRSEPPLALVAAELDRLGVETRWFDQRRALETSLGLEVAGGGVTGELADPDGRLPLDEVRAVYVRVMDDRLLPEVEHLPPDAPERAHVRALHDKLAAWIEIAPALVVNRALAQASNAAKPYQLQLIAAAGFAVPDTLITSDPEAVIEFRARHGRLVYKSMSGIRSIVDVLTDLDVARLDRIRWCPVQFQAWVDGIDLRVHTVGEEVFATRVTNWATDYRYPGASGAPNPVVEPYPIDADLGERCVRLAASLGLELSGIDLRITPDGEAVCFEVNPSPAFSYYEQAAGVPIAAALARRLAAA